jgi:cob(I)alamin adenosyltransferase
MSKYYTRTGDDGTTGLLGEGRVPKNHPIPEAIGAIDEATAALGLARATCHDPAVQSLLPRIQRDLYHLMSEIAATQENAARFRKIDGGRVAWIEGQIETFGERVEMPKEFILPGDTEAGGTLALARTVIRRAERKVARLYHDGALENNAVLQYLNRLSSLCFLLEILENRLGGVENLSLAKE